MSQPAHDGNRGGVGGDFDLVDHHGEKVSLRNYQGRYVLLYFGFTHCRVVCPRSLGKISTALVNLGPTARHIQPLYITVDPARDTPGVMKRFLEENFPLFTGLTGTQGEIDHVKRLFRVYAQKRRGKDAAEDYDMPHTAFAYVLDPEGVYLTHFSDTYSADEMARKLEQIIREGPPPG